MYKIKAVSRVSTILIIIIAQIILITPSRAIAASDVWQPTTTNGAPVARTGHTLVWAGTEMIIWGGQTDYYTSTNTGGRYDPVTDTWTTMSTINAPTPRRFHSAVWNGSEMIIWGGESGAGLGTKLNTGGAYNPATDTWRKISTLDTPLARTSNSTIWTGTEMIIWGGSLETAVDPDIVTNTGGRYNPISDTWTSISTLDAPSGRTYPNAVWSGTEMIVWGGTLNHRDAAAAVNTGAIYNPTTDSWRSMASTGAPAATLMPSFVWTGKEMIVWGGGNADGTFSNNGSRYNFTSNAWTPMETIGAPTPRAYASAVWTGTEMIIWGGYNNQTRLNTGGVYNPSTNSWVSTSQTNAPEGRNVLGNCAIWTGTEMVIWGGWVNPITVFAITNTGGRYTPGFNNPIYNFNGFFQPIDNLPVQNVIQAGRAVPVKFSLHGDYGLNIFSTGYPKSQQIGCESQFPVDVIEQTVAANTSNLTYDPSTDIYTYVWKTDRTWVKSCRQLILKLNDETFHQADFIFK